MKKEKDFIDRIHENLDNAPDGVSFRISTTNPSKKITKKDVKAVMELYEAVKPIIEKAEKSGERFL